MEMNSTSEFASTIGARLRWASEGKHSPMLASLLRSCKIHAGRNAFYINGTNYTYSQLAAEIAATQQAVHDVSHRGEKFIGIVVNNDFHTYASLLGVWFSGLGYVPLNPRNPVERSLEIFRQAGVQSIIASETNLLT